jgi:DNA-binding transcriptional ArsR family regulator
MGNEGGKVTADNEKADAAAFAGPPLAARRPTDRDAPSKAASAFRKALSDDGRLTIPFLLLDGQRPVSVLEQRPGARQAALRQHLARLGSDGRVASRPRGKTIRCRINAPRIGQRTGCLGPCSARRSKHP